MASKNNPSGTIAQFAFEQLHNLNFVGSNEMSYERVLKSLIERALKTLMWG